jgi:anion-transporting  ArsA/GET3 family ATPase
MNASAHVPSIREMVERMRIIVCCGAGGVGKTTTSAALALSAARLGRRVLVLTIDPSKRLAETLGVSQNPPSPVPLPEERAKLAGIEAPGRLDAWMLDHKLVADTAVRRLVSNPEEAERVLQNRIYQQVSSMMAGMHEYTAMEALYRLVSEGTYDLVVLDTPPSRHALDFLEAPKRLSRFVDSKALQAFLPSSGGLVARATTKLVGRVLRGVLGDSFADELSAFFALFMGLFQALSVEVSTMRAFLARPDVAFLLVTSPSPSTLAEAHFFQEKTRELDLPFRGFVLNRSRALHHTRPFPDASFAGPAPSESLVSGLRKLAEAATEELERAGADRAILRDLETRAGDRAVAVALPELRHGADDMTTLLRVGDALLAS